jgi:flagellar biosynthetic protein FliR
MLESLVLGYAVGLGLTAARIAGFMVVSPVPGQYAPRQTRVGFLMVLSALVAVLLAEPVKSMSVGAIAVHAGFELGLGLLIGLTFRFVLAAGDVLGGVLAQATGHGSGFIFNPESNKEETPVERAVSLLSVMLAFAVGAHRVALSYLLESFRALPVGGFAPLPLAAPLLAELASTAMAVGVRLAMPVLGVSLALQLVLALVGRAAPSLQIFSIGFTVTILGGMLTLSISLRPIASGFVDHLGSLEDTFERLLLSLAPG